MSEALECAGDRILQLVREAESKGWCTRPFCTTCGNGELRSRLAAVPDLTEHLIRLNLDEIIRSPSRVDSLTIIMLTQSVDWDQVLEAWMPRAVENTRLLDLVLFRVIGRRLPFQRSQPMRAWVKASVDRACRFGDESLVESLVYVLGVSGEGLGAYPELVAVARDLSEQSHRVRRALTKSGLLRDEDSSARRARAAQDAAKATRSIFLAVASGDLKGVTALLKKGPDLRAQNAEGLTALELARQLGRTEITDLLSGASGDR